MKFLITRLSDKKGQPIESAQLMGKTDFGDPVYGVEVASIEDLMKCMTRARSSAPGDVGLVLWKKVPQSMTVQGDLADYPLIEIYDDVRDSY